MVEGQLDVHIQKNEVGPLTLNAKFNYKWRNDLNVRFKNIKLLEKNIGVNICYPGSYNSF